MIIRRECLFFRQSWIMSESKALGFLFERTTRIIKLNFHQLFKELNVDITPEQWVILDILHQKGVLSQKEIADHSFKDAPSISRILNNLTKRALITRTTPKSDKRVSSVCLTEKGNRLIENILPEVESLRDRGIQNIESSDLANLISTMDKIFANYNN